MHQKQLPLLLTSTTVKQATITCSIGELNSWNVLRLTSNREFPVLVNSTVDTTYGCSASS
jgi:hypothetical protein